MSAQALKNKIERMSTRELIDRITKYRWALSKTEDKKERAVMISVINQFKNVLAKRLILVMYLITNLNIRKS